jgi:hypothetical protein
MKSFLRSRVSSVSIVMSYRLNCRGSTPSTGKRFCSDRLWGPPSLLSTVYRGAISPGVNRPGLEADQSPPSSVEVENDGTILPLLHTCFLWMWVVSYMVRPSWPLRGTKFQYTFHWCLSKPRSLRYVTVRRTEWGKWDGRDMQHTWERWEI